MIICTQCNKREGSWWDHECNYCKRMPKKPEAALEYEKRYGNTGVLTPEQMNMEKNNEGEKYNKSAVTGFILSLISILGLGVLGIVGFILGIVALVQIKYTNEKGKGLSIAAIIIGFLWSFGVGIVRRLVEEGY